MCGGQPVRGIGPHNAQRTQSEKECARCGDDVRFLARLGTGAAGLAFVASKTRSGGRQSGEDDPKHAGMRKSCCDACGECAKACNKAFHHCVEQAQPASRPRQDGSDRGRLRGLLCVVRGDDHRDKARMMAFRRCALVPTHAGSFSTGMRDIRHRYGYENCLDACQRCEESCRNMVKAMGHERRARTHVVAVGRPARPGGRLFHRVADFPRAAAIRTGRSVGIWASRPGATFVVPSLLGWWYGRQRDDELAAAIRPLAVGLHAAAVHLDEPAHQGQADPQPPLRAVERAVDLGEQVEDGRRFSRRRCRSRCRGPGRRLRSRRACTSRSIRPPSSVYLAALFSRLASTWASRTRSALTRDEVRGQVDGQLVPAGVDQRPAGLDGAGQRPRRRRWAPCGAGSCLR